MNHAAECRRLSPPWNQAGLWLARSPSRKEAQSALPRGSVSSGAAPVSCSGRIVLVMQPVRRSRPPTMEAGASISPKSSAAKPAAHNGSVATMTDESAAGSFPSARVCRTTVKAVETRPV
eukprot:scaffold76296_cov26-Tisochrysis_lutea.AAC.2